ncbi:unnamed protein product [Vitrella brassicaformis CCMP3155]|uniref:Uncharacterized protein n=1 Tax=Vitrella brassicaformis (strain CCMP3155) TaxID=1169540 RepID=A0A0G4H5B8_VITBC|nr:unnamed protein product [Vitrella brassicaformis CCMP3155]|eukprot:CEM38822.1 unnamed protein product [Vitrella brassicaformis CCMP3155]
MSDRLVGLFWGRNTFTDGRGGFYYKAQEQQMAIRPEHYGDIRLAANVTDDLRQLTAAAAGGGNGVGATLRQRKEGSSSSQQQPANRSSVGRRTGTSRYGYPYQVVEEGTGRRPKAGTLNLLKFDRIGWSDAFDGQSKAYDLLGVVRRVSGRAGWLDEALLSMKEGEVRNVTVPDEYAPYVELRLISIE